MGSATTVYASAARTATPTVVTFSMGANSTLRLMLDATAITSTPSIVVTVDMFDALSAKFINVLTASAITSVSSNPLGPIQGLRGQVKVTVTHGNANSITYSVSAHRTI